MAWLSAAEVAAMPDDERLPVVHNAVLAALKGDRGLPEDMRFPVRDETYRGFLVAWE